MKALESVLFPLGFVLLLYAPLVVCYAFGAFVLWDVTWIADAAYHEARAWTAIVQTVWLLAFGIAASGS